MKRKNFYRLSAFVIVFYTGLLVGCGSKSPEQGSGVAATQERVLGNFEKINATGLGKVIIRFGTSDRCVVRTDDNLIDHYETRVDDSTLFLSPTRFMSPRSGITTTIDTTAAVNSIEVHGACQIVLQQFDQEELTISAHDACEVSAAGKTRTLNLTVEGSTELDLSKLNATDIKLKAEGNSRINLKAKGTLEVIADGAVVVTYEGDAEVTQALTGVSRIQKR